MRGGRSAELRPVSVPQAGQSRENPDDLRRGGPVTVDPHRQTAALDPEAVKTLVEAVGVVLHAVPQGSCRGVLVRAST